MHKKIIFAILSLGIIASPFLSVSTAKASPEDNIAKTKVQFQKLDDSTIELNSQIGELNSQIWELNSKLEKSTAEINSTKDKINVTEKNIESAESDIENKKDILGSRLRSMYKSEYASNPLALLLTAENLTDLINKTKIVTTIVSLDKDVIKKLNNEKESLKSNIETLSEKKKSLEELQSSNKNAVDELNNKKQEQKVKLDALNEQKKQLASVIESNEKMLVQNAMSVIDSSTSQPAITNAMSTLKSFLNQLSTESVKDSVKKSIQKGNDKLKAISNQGISRGTSSGSNIAHGNALKTLTMEATAYSDGLLTASGLRPSRDPNGISTIAVDPSVIPLGTKVFIPGYGVAIASDTGGLIKGNIVDLYMNSNSECENFGRRNVQVQILAYPGQW